MRRAIKYADEHGLRIITPRPPRIKGNIRSFEIIKEENDQEGVEKVIFTALYEGCDGQLPRNDSGISKAITKGLEKRENFFNESFPIVKKLKKPTNLASKDTNLPFVSYSIIVCDDLGYARQTLDRAEIEYENRYHLASLPNLKYLHESYEGRLNLVKALCGSLTHKVGFVTEIGNVKEQAVIIRGYLAAIALEAFGEENKTYDPFFFDFQDLTELAVVGQLIREDKSKFNQIIDTAMVRFGEVGELESEIKSIFENYLNFIVLQTARWNGSSKSSLLSIENPQYWTNLQNFFEGLPVDAKSASQKYGFTPESALEAHRDKMPHLWRNADNIQSYLIPSGRDLARAILLLHREGAPLAYSTFLPMLNGAIRARQHFDEVTFRYPNQITQLEKELMEIDQAMLVDQLTSSEAQEFINSYELRSKILTRTSQEYEQALNYEQRVILKLNLPLKEDRISVLHEYIVMISNELEDRQRELINTKDRTVTKLKQPSWLDFDRFTVSKAHPNGSLEVIDPTDTVVIDSKLIRISRIRAEYKIARAKYLTQIRRSSESNLDGTKSINSDLESQVVVDMLPAQYLEDPEKLISFLNWWKGKSENANEVGKLRRVITIISNRSPNPQQRKYVKNVFFTDLKLLEKNNRRLKFVLQEEREVSELRIQVASCLSTDYIKGENEFRAKAREILALNDGNTLVGELRLSILPKAIKDDLLNQVNISEYGAQLNQAENLLREYRSIFSRKIVKLEVSDSLQIKEEIDSYLGRVESEPLYLGASHSRAISFLNNLSQMADNPFWPVVQDRPLSRLMAYLKSRVQIAKAHLYKVEVDSQLSELKNQHKYYESLKVQEKLKVRSVRLQSIHKYKRFEYDHAQDLLLKKMRELGLALPANYFSEGE